MKDSVREYVLGMAVGSFFGALLGMLFLGIVIGARIGGYIKFKLNERGELMTHEQSRCKVTEEK